MLLLQNGVEGQKERGWLVLASDVTHYYEHMESGRPGFTTTFHVGDTLEGYSRLRAIAPSPDHIVHRGTTPS